MLKPRTPLSGTIVTVKGNVIPRLLRLLLLLPLLARVWCLRLYGPDDSAWVPLSVTIVHCTDSCTFLKDTLGPGQSDLVSQTLVLTKELGR